MTREQHVGRGWPGLLHVEDECPCPQQSCGLIAESDIDPKCEQHPLDRSKTMRSSHAAADCPGVRADAPVEPVDRPIHPLPTETGDPA